MRYNNTERIGVNKTEQIFIEEIGWIFREQPLVDVGIDALIEISEEGVPKGNFLAAQIKSGKGNFYQTSNSLIYYVSNIHYYYWINLDLPIILIGYIPEEKKAYWQHISKKNLEKTNKGWKIELPQNKILNKKSVFELKKIIEKSNSSSKVLQILKGNIIPENVYDIAEGVESIKDATKSVNNINIAMSELREKTEINKIKIMQLVKIGLSDKDPQSIAVIKSIAKSLNIFTVRIKNELEIFSESFAEGVYSFEKVSILLLILTNKKDILKSIIKVIENIPLSSELAIDGLKSLLDVINRTNYNIILKSSQKEAKLAVETVIQEFTDAKILSENLIKSFERILNENNVI